MKSNVILKIAVAISVGGTIVRPGELVEVTNAEAKDLCARGKAVPATEEDFEGADIAATSGSVPREENETEQAFEANAEELANDPTPPAGKPKNDKQGKR